MPLQPTLQNNNGTCKCEHSNQRSRTNMHKLFPLPNMSKVATSPDLNKSKYRPRWPHDVAVPLSTWTRGSDYFKSAVSISQQSNCELHSIGATVERQSCVFWIVCCNHLKLAIKWNRIGVISWRFYRTSSDKIGSGIWIWPWCSVCVNSIYRWFLNSSGI